MSEILLPKFRSKSKEELQEILEKPHYYDPLSIAAAQTILKEKEEQERLASIHESKVTSKKKYKESTKSFHFIETYQWSDFWTMIAVAFFWMCLQAIIGYYGGEPIFEEVSVLWLSLPLFLIMPLIGHVFYRFDHGYSNNFLGRWMATTFLICLFAIIGVVYDYYRDGIIKSIFEDTESVLMSFVVIIVISVVYEALVWLLRKFLRALKWDVL